MNGKSTDWLPWVVTFFLVVGGILAAIRKEFLLSGSFALYFIGYSIIRITSLMRRPDMQVPPALRILGFVLVLAATFFLLYWYLTARV